MSFEGKDYYEILGVSREATEDEIRRAYRQKARQLHPDVNKAPDAAAQFSKIQEAYDILSDDEKREAYDNFLRHGVRSGGPGRGGEGTWQSADYHGFDPSDFASIFEQMMGGGQRAGRARAGRGFNVDFGPAGAQRVRAPQRGAEIRETIVVSFMDAALGTTRTIHLTKGDKTETIEVRVPPGIGDGAKLRIKGKGQPGPGGGPAGDLILTVHVGEHPYFRREGLDILLDVPINIAEAMLGTKVDVPLLRGSISLQVPPGTSSGRRLRARGKGIDTGKMKGDFLAVIQIVAPAPSDLAEADRAAIMEMSERLKNPRDNAPWSDIR